MYLIDTKAVPQVSLPGINTSRHVRKYIYCMSWRTTGYNRTVLRSRTSCHEIRHA